ncbi:MAG: hypothetical protein HYX42_04035 [Polaromonas sp.]|uniref:hypothetical protein n=1 Tax=Polaromonas sp. TaxID=1869339 RepID=UPI0025FBC20A|nr:hypothetical protein [Polaromonas sp.]MBI2725400.1 hypothetical protein [Polaromonas sp.]
MLPTRSVIVLDLIKRAYRLIGAYSIGETPSADESADGLTALNAMLDDWANEKLMLYAPTLDAITLTPGLATYTVGPTGSTVSDRPMEIDPASYIQYNSLSYPLDVVTLAEYNALTLKSLATLIPDTLWCNPTFPNATITLYPTPTAAMTLNLWSWKQLTAFSAITDAVLLPPGYENAIVYNLAEALAPENELPIPAAVHLRATGSKRGLKRTNFVPPMLSLAGVGQLGGGRFNILAGRVL